MTQSTHCHGHKFPSIPSESPLQFKTVAHHNITHHTFGEAVVCGRPLSDRPQGAALLAALKVMW